MTFRSLHYALTGLTFAGSLGVSSITGASENVNSLPLLKPQTRTLALFKNGLGFVFKSGEVQPQDGWVRAEQLPPAALGALWIGTTTKGASVSEVVSYKQKETQLGPALNNIELLSANIGKRVILTYSTGNSVKSVEGTILGVPIDRKADESAIDPAAAARGWRPPEEATRGEVVLMRVEEGGRSRILSLNRSIIQTLELADDATLEASTAKEVRGTRIHLSGNPKSAEVTFAYLEKGVIWSPSYRINTENEKTAAITLEAVLANDAEDLENTDVSFVVGYPNFLYADLLSPLSVQQSVASFVQSLMTERRSDQFARFGNVMAQSIAYNSPAFDPGSRPDAGYSTAEPLPGDSSEDLYFYRKSGVTLKKGDRARFIVFEAQVPYEHVYLWDIPDTMNVDDRGFRQDANTRKEPDQQVWHVLRLENTTQQPWTTAPAFTLNGALPVAQDTLGYAPPGGKSSLKLTVATDIRAEPSQTEVARKPLNIDSRAFDEVTVAGKLKVKNWKSKETCIVIKKSLVGEVLSADSDGKTTKVARRIASVNPTSEIDWEFHLAASQEKELQYQYKVLVYR